jgi:hypothetical protein
VSGLTTGKVRDHRRLVRDREAIGGSPVFINLNGKGGVLHLSLGRNVFVWLDDKAVGHRCAYPLPIVINHLA